jgi:hypothetical protein
MRQVMLKLKNARNVDARQSLMVDTAYFQCKPPDNVNLKRKQRPPVQEYMRYLINDVLDKDNIVKACFFWFNSSVGVSGWLHCVCANERNPE